jgi:hypothetical protein
MESTTVHTTGKDQMLWVGRDPHLLIMPLMDGLGHESWLRPIIRLSFFVERGPRNLQQELSQALVIPCAAKYCSRSCHLLSTSRRDVEGSLAKPTNMPAKSQIGLGQNSSSLRIIGKRLVVLKIRVRLRYIQKNRGSANQHGTLHPQYDEEIQGPIKPGSMNTNEQISW